MSRALYTAATGMIAQQMNVDNIANNLANVTRQDKKRKLEFQDLLYQQLRLAGATQAEGAQVPVELQIGYGTRPVATQRIFSQGTVISTRASVPVRIKDMARLQLGEEIQLTGMGLIIGLEGTGDGRQASFTLRMLANMMKRMQLAVDPTQIRVRNVAAVSTTATLSPYHRKGSRIDVQVASLGDAETLQGGTLLCTPLL
ncbi:MAG TPA: hypothetical protein DIC52_03540, partial [Candidatus Latescibacteria bacterium]|nr:hypothetical protein [Candidatus Latescibacterota bacterium]